MNNLTITLRSEQRRPRGQIRFNKAEAVIRKNQVTTFVIDVSPEDNEKISRVKPGWGLILAEDDLTISGPITTNIRNNEGGLVERKLGGISDLHILEDRITLPDPTLPVSDQNVAYYKDKGAAETIIKKLVSANAGITAISGRRTPGLVIAPSEGRGGAATINTRLKNLLEEVAAIAETAGLVLDCFQQANSTDIIFDVRPVKNRARKVRLTSRNDELTSYTNEQTAPTTTAVIVGGQGEGAARTITEFSNNDGWGGRRIEIFKDRRDTEELEEARKTAMEELGKGGAGIDLTFSVHDSQARRFGRDYQVGDIITVELENGAIFTEQLTSARITWKEGTREVELTVGNSDDDKVTTNERKQIRALSSQILSLQAQ